MLSPGRRGGGGGGGLKVGRGRRKRLGRWSWVGIAETILFYIGLCYVQSRSPFQIAVRGPGDSSGNGGTQGAVDKCIYVSSKSRGGLVQQSPRRARGVSGFWQLIRGRKTIWGEAEGRCATVWLFPGCSVCWLYWALGIWEWHMSAGEPVRPSGTGHRTAKRLQCRWCSVWTSRLGLVTKA